MKFAVKITETLERTVIIEAEDKYQALEIVEDKANGEINLDANDFPEERYHFQMNFQMVLFQMMWM